MKIPPLERPWNGSLTDVDARMLSAARAPRQCPKLDGAHLSGFTQCTFQSSAIPAAAIGGSRIGCPKEIQDQLIRIARCVHNIIGQNEFSQGLIEIGTFGD